MTGASSTTSPSTASAQDSMTPSSCSWFASARLCGSTKPMSWGNSSQTSAKIATNTSSYENRELVLHIRLISLVFYSQLPLLPASGPSSPLVVSGVEHRGPCSQLSNSMFQPQPQAPALTSGRTSGRRHHFIEAAVIDGGHDMRLSASIN